MSVVQPVPFPLTTLPGLRYGFLGFPLAFCALPLYVLLPNLYAREFGIGLATLGAVLLGARLFDAIIDPLLGRWCDRLYQRSLFTVYGFGAFAAVVLSGGFGLLFFPLTREPVALVVSTGLLLVLTYSAYSALSVAHQSWGAMLGGDGVAQSRVVAWREGLGLFGVVTAAALPSLLGLKTMVAVFVVGLLAGWLLWLAAPRPVVVVALQQTGDMWQPWRVGAFRRLMLVFSLNGVASAVPATLVLFFVQDRLEAPDAMQPLFLGSYFLVGALSMPLWLRMVKRFGLAASWLLGMLLAIIVFTAALSMSAGDTWPFIAVCAVSGLALGSDLVLPGAMLAGVIERSGHRGQAEGTYFGWWNFASKLNLALAAGLALPLLQWLGYSPGARSPEALGALTAVYCLVPCVLKAIAALALYHLLIKPERRLESQ